ncbi:helix-turn-helix transcriptional regulator [Spiractinospora alimapuensis]|nr:helix-turn-helix transcriptional regulator [Spiractinospora alimapuensis]QVQ54955.1 helix-turn-helix transcriptional regulator [Spiractinospora alimapuensis]
MLRDLIGQALRRARKAQDKTLREVADAAQVSLPYLSEIERGRKEPSSEVLAAVNRALGMGLDELLGTLTADLRPAAPVATLPSMRAPRQDGSSAMLLAA